MGETYVEIETAERTNYPLLLPEKTLWVRCLPETVTMASGEERATRNVYVDMTRDSYKGVLMSAYNAPNVLPVGSEVLVLVKKEVKTNEVYPKVMAGYGCENGSTDPLANVGADSIYRFSTVHGNPKGLLCLRKIPVRQKDL